MSLVVRAILQKQGRLTVPVDQLDDRADLHLAGLDSMAMVNVMLALEQALDIEFPEELMTRRVFSTVGSIDSVLRQLVPDFEQTPVRV